MTNTGDRGRRRGGPALHPPAAVPGQAAAAPAARLPPRRASTPGEQRDRAGSTLPPADLAFWDVTRGRLVVEAAPHTVMVGRSSTDIRQCGDAVGCAGETIPPRDALDRAARAPSTTTTTPGSRCATRARPRGDAVGAAEAGAWIAFARRRLRTPAPAECRPGSARSATGRPCIDAAPGRSAWRAGRRRRCRVPCTGGRYAWAEASTPVDRRRGRARPVRGLRRGRYPAVRHAWRSCGDDRPSSAARTARSEPTWSPSPTWPGTPGSRRAPCPTCSVASGRSRRPPGSGCWPASGALGYHPHAGARSLASNRSNVIALVLPLRSGMHLPVLMQFASVGGHHRPPTSTTTCCWSPPTRARPGCAGSPPARWSTALVLMDVEMRDARVPLLRELDRPSVLIGFPRRAGRAHLRRPRLLPGRRRLRGAPGRPRSPGDRAARRAAGGLRTRHRLRPPHQGRLPGRGRAAGAPRCAVGLRGELDAVRASSSGSVNDRPGADRARGAQRGGRRARARRAARAGAPRAPRRLGGGDLPGRGGRAHHSRR